jgi:hypothetical protein
MILQVQLFPHTSLSSDYSDMVLVEYTTPAPPIVSEAQIVQKSPLHKIDLYPNPLPIKHHIVQQTNEALGSIKIYDVTEKCCIKNLAVHS